MVCLKCNKEFNAGRRTKPFCHDCLPASVYNKGGSSSLSPLWKEYAIKAMGGECVECGYNKCKGALQFHHLRDKKYNIVDLTRMRGVDNKKLLDEELEKCVLLCANCHAEKHEAEGFEGHR